MRKIVAKNSKLIEEKKIEDNIRKVEKKLQGKSQNKNRDKIGCVILGNSWQSFCVVGTKICIKSTFAPSLR